MLMKHPPHLGRESEDTEYVYISYKQPLYCHMDNPFPKCYFGATALGRTRERWFIDQLKTKVPFGFNIISWMRILNPLCKTSILSVHLNGRLMPIPLTVNWCSSNVWRRPITLKPWSRLRLAYTRTRTGESCYRIYIWWVALRRNESDQNEDVE